MGFDALGIDIGAKRCKAARALLVESVNEGPDDRGVLASLDGDEPSDE